MKTVLLIITALLATSAESYATLIDFENVPGLYQETNGRTNLGNYYTGVTFGPHALVYSSSYNSIHYPPHSGVAVLSSGGFNYIDMVFDTKVSDLSFWYTSATSSNNIPNHFEVQAFSDTSMTNKIGSVTGPYNWGSTSNLILDYDNIMAIKFTGAVDHFLIDDISYNQSNTVPEPSTMILLAAWIVGLVTYRFKKYETNR